jgi:hypothetical protein
LIKILKRGSPGPLRDLPIARIQPTVLQKKKPTKKQNNGGVLRKRQTSSRARFNQSGVRDAVLEMVKGALKLKRGKCLR